MSMKPKATVVHQVQLYFIATALIVLVTWLAYRVAVPFSLWSLPPLGFLLFAATRVIFELTLNRANVPTIATGFQGRKKMAEILATAAEGKKPFKILDLGSGRGELTRHIAKKIPAAEVLGIELARFPCWQSHVVQRLFGPSNLSYRCLDFWRMDCSEIDAIVFFLTPNFAQRVGEKLAAELKPGSIVISHTFPLLGRWTPAEVIEFRTPFKETLYVYLKS